MTNEDLLHLFTTVFVEYKGQWYSVPGGWVVNMRKAGFKVVSQSPTAQPTTHDKTV